MTTDGKTPLLKRKFPQIRGRNIYQLARAAKRLSNIAAGAIRADWNKFPAARLIYQDKITMALEGQKALGAELARRQAGPDSFVRDVTPGKHNINRALAMAA